MRRSLLLLSFSLVVATLAGCGNKGPLTFPPTKPAATTPAPAAPATAASSAMPAAQQP
jgi:predicted small lipoprotein YifL